MSKKKTIQCNDCDQEININDKFEEYVIEDFKYCPICGSSNIEVNE